MAEGIPMKLIKYSSRDNLMAGLADVLAQALATALSQHNTVSFAVPGGTTPGPLFDALSAVALDWARVRVLLTDERWVPETHAQSNAALVRARLLQGAAQAAHFTPYHTSEHDIVAAAENLSARLSDELPIDVLLLGMGADMHTASLFPGAGGLDAALADDAPMFAPINVEGQDVARFTLTASALRGARDTHLLITGEDKRHALTQAETLPAPRAPVQIILPNATVHWSAE